MNKWVTECLSEWGSKRAGWANEQERTFLNVNIRFRWSGICSCAPRACDAATDQRCVYVSTVVCKRFQIHKQTVTILMQTLSVWKEEVRFVVLVSDINTYNIYQSYIQRGTAHELFYFETRKNSFCTNERTNHPTKRKFIYFP